MENQSEQNDFSISVDFLADSILLVCNGLHVCMESSLFRSGSFAEPGYEPFLLFGNRHVAVVQFYGVVGLTERTYGAARVYPVAFFHVFQDFLVTAFFTFGLQFVIAALGTDFGRGGHEYFELGIGEHRRADVPSVHDDTFFPSHLLLEADHGFAHETECGHDADFGRYGQRTDVVFHQGPVQIGLWLSRLGIALESDVYVRKGGFQAFGVYLIAVE